ncbi:MAG: sigma-70 family RNA polymerase sigma factor [Clostridia bacterium]|nr:sigma-70 family RNA polymerase sigma factor [Clostridia bacterium]
MISYGTGEAVARLVETYGDMLLRLASTRLRCPADAEDAVQEVFLYLLEHGVTFQSEEHEKAWLIRATIHRACDMRKRAARTDLPLEDAVIAAVPEPDSDLLDAVRALPEKYSTPLYLRYYVGYSVKEIGRLLGLPAATAGTRLARGRALLKRELQEE